jgi:cytochrome c peroxidase
MKRNVLIRSILVLLSLALFGLTAYLSSKRVSAQSADAQSRVYFPYPPGLIPSDLPKEAKRVEGEVDALEREAFAQWKALPLNPGTAKRQVELLGKLELFDRNLSVNKNEACSFCHMPYTGFSGPISSVNATVVAYPGSARWRFGKRKPQGYTYSPLYPKLQYNQTLANFYGGNFWDLRATGYRTQSPDAEQAQGPPHDTQEMGLPDTACVVYRIAKGKYASQFKTVWGPQAFEIHWPADTEKICSTPAGDFGTNQTPLSLSAEDRGQANAAYDEFALSIDAYEASPDVSAFSSKFDGYLAGNAQFQLTSKEKAGYDIFRGKGNCNSCHLDGRSTAPAPTDHGATDSGVAASVAPLFTDFTSANLGLPRNKDNPFYFENKPDAFGFIPNPAGAAFTDLGVGLFLRSESGTNPDTANWLPLAPKFDGFMQVATARNSDMRPYPTFVKSYMHNGYLKSLKEVVHFYNTRDTYKSTAADGSCPAATEKLTCWPEPEVPATKDMTIGSLGLTEQEENELVAFLKTLTDGATRPYPDKNSFGKGATSATSSDEQAPQP